MAVGTILRFDEIRGYGFIAPEAGGEDVFVHANDFGEAKRLVRPGARVEYEVEEGERGLKVATVTLLDSPPRRSAPLESPFVPRAQPAEDDEGVCDVLSAKAFTSAVTELLIEHAPTLTGGQISQVRLHLMGLARSHGWVDG